MTNRRPGIGLIAGGLGAYRPHLADTAGVFAVLGVGQTRDGRYTLVAAGTVADGPHMKIGNTTSRVDIGHDPGEWTDDWSASGVGHHRALGTGCRS